MDIKHSKWQLSTKIKMLRLENRTGDPYHFKPELEFQTQSLQKVLETILRGGAQRGSVWFHNGPCHDFSRLGSFDFTPGGILR